jgi:hypothetical protein
MDSVYTAESPDTVMFHNLIPVVIPLTLIRLAAAHTWIEQLTNIAPNGTYVAGYGYARSFVDRLPSFDQEANKWLIPQQRSFVDPTDLLCHPYQRTAAQSPMYPRLQASPESVVAMRYAENGHVTIPGGGRGLRGKPDLGGTVFVFGTQDPHQDETLLNVLAWTYDGAGGDKRGLLLAAQNFDDGRCYQLGNDAPLSYMREKLTPNPVADQPGSQHELLCETDVRLPSDVEVGKPYTLYWVWQWPTLRTENPPCEMDAASCPKDEYYTSCVDVDVVLEVQSKQGENPSSFKDPMPTAVQDFLSRTALIQNPLALYSNPDFNTSITGTAPANSLMPGASSFAQVVRRTISM